MSDKKVELNAENLEGVAGGLGAKVKTGDVGNTQTSAGAEKKGDVSNSTTNSDNIDNVNEGGKQNVVNMGRGNTANGNISFGKSK